jgi:uncharacterized protein (TIGR00290 family)
VKTRAAVSWSGGKDSALMLDRLLGDERYEVVALVTTLESASQLVSAHGIPIELVARQAASIGLPLVRVALPSHPSNEAYLASFEAALRPMHESGTATIAFGDIFLEDLRRWREASFAAMGFASIFPLWGEPSPKLADEFFARGFAAVLCCVNGAYLDEPFIGRLYDPNLLRRLPANVDCCGENGEFHTFTFDGPIFREPVRYAIGATSYRTVMHGSPNGHWFAEIRPHDAGPEACPLCGGDNTCAAVSGEASCWCFSERISAEVRERIPPYARDAACVCRGCAERLAGARKL